LQPVAVDNFSDESQILRIHDISIFPAEHYYFY